MLEIWTTTKKFQLRTEATQDVHIKYHDKYCLHTHFLCFLLISCLALALPVRLLILGYIYDIQELLSVLHAGLWLTSAACNYGQL